MNSSAVLLPTHTVDVLHAPEAEDSHGWVTRESQGVSWSGAGSLQLAGPASDPAMSEGGGAGPLRPRHIRTGDLYLPTTAPVTEGGLVRAAGRTWVVETVREVWDPAGGGLEVWHCTVVQYDEAVPDG